MQCELRIQHTVSLFFLLSWLNRVAIARSQKGRPNLIKHCMPTHHSRLLTGKSIVKPHEIRFCQLVTDSFPCYQKLLELFDVGKFRNARLDGPARFAGYLQLVESLSVTSRPLGNQHRQTVLVDVGGHQRILLCSSGSESPVRTNTVEVLSKLR